MILDPEISWKAARISILLYSFLDHYSSLQGRALVLLLNITKLGTSCPNVMQKN